jgi:opacity protein-like surface antigen
MTQPWRVLAAAALVCATFGVGTAAAQTVLARHVPAGEQVEVMLNGTSVGTGRADEAGDARVSFDMQKAIGKSEMDANVYVDRCETTHRVWIVEVGGPLPAEGTCNLRSVSGLFWVRDVNTIVINDVTAAIPSLLLIKGRYTPPAPGEESRPSGPQFDVPAGLVVFGGGGYLQTTDATGVFCGDVSSCTGSESGFGFTVGAEYRFHPVLSVEFSYVKPPAATVSGAESTFRFTTEQKVDFYTVTGKVGVPFGRAKVYGRAGMSFNQAKVLTTQTQDPRTVTVDDAPFIIPGGTQVIDLRTDGFGWLFGGGLEVWANRTFAVFGEFSYGNLQGEDVNNGEGRIDNHLTSIIGGLRVHIGK